MRHVARACLAAAVFASAWASSRARAAEPDEKTQCISASDEGQQLRDDGKFKLAGDAFARCSRKTCPGLVRQGCAQWLVDLEAKVPSVVISAKDDKGNDLVDVRVTVDGADFTAKLDGLPAVVDGGDHVFRYEAAGFAPVEEHLVIRAGEKNRVLNVLFIPNPTPLLPAPANPPAEGTHPPLTAWIFAGVAVAAFASEAYFGIAGIGQYNQDTGPGGCAGHCAPSEKSSIQTQFAIADVSLGLGVVSAGLAAYFFLRPRAPNATQETAVDVAARPGGGVATLSGHF
jgi:hypothetical protein